MKTTMGGALLALGLAGCAQVLDIPDNPEVVGRWRCLSDPPPAPVPLRTQATVRVQACNFMTQCTQKVANLRARVCPQVDRFCTNVLVDNVTDENEDGLLTFTVSTPPMGFNGYVEVTSQTAPCMDEGAFGTFSPMMCQLARQRGCDPDAPDEKCEMPIYARSLFFFNPPIFNDVMQPLMLPLIPAAEIPTMLEGAGASLNPTTGNLFITALDCDGKPASGVTYSLLQSNQETTQLYVRGGVPNPLDLQTDDSGVGGFLGVPDGYANVTAYNESLDEVGETAVHAAPFTMTYTAITPLRY